MKKGMVYTPAGLKVVEYDDSYDFISTGVGGYIELVPCDRLSKANIDMWCNEEGKLWNFDKMIALSYEGNVYDFVVGNVVFTRHSKDGKTLSLTDKNIELIKKIFDESPTILVYDECDPAGRSVHPIKCLEVL